MRDSLIQDQLKALKHWLHRGGSIGVNFAEAFMLGRKIIKEREI